MFKIKCCEYGNEAEISIENEEFTLTFDGVSQLFDKSSFTIGCGYGGEIGITCNKCKHSITEK